MHRVGPEPKNIFSPEQRAEIARSISPHTIPSKEWKAICVALFVHDLARIDIERALYEKNESSTRRQVDPTAKGLAALKNFIQYARGLRLALYSVEKYLSKDLVKEGQQLVEQVYKFQKSAQQELDKKSLGGRPAQEIRDDLVNRLGVICKRLIGKTPTRIVRSGKVGGEFAQFVYAIFRARGMPVKGLPNAIKNAVTYVKNQH